MSTECVIYTIVVSSLVLKTSIDMFSSVETNYLLLYSHQYNYVRSRTEKKALNGIRTIENIRSCYRIVVASLEIGM